MNSLQQKELEILKAFVKICESLELPYFLVCGSALGAVKYGGFIPWDDDIDVALLRHDYEIFLTEAPKLLPDHFFLQNYHTNPSFPAIFSKIRDSNTTFIEKSAARLPINHGIYIDVFPLDGYPRGKLRQRLFEARKQIYRRLLSVAFVPNRWWKWLLIAPFRVIGTHKRTNRIAQRYERMIASFPIENSPLLCNHGNWQGQLDYFPPEVFGEGRLATFEGMEIVVPQKVEVYLAQKYGDYHTDPPYADRIGHHYALHLDCERSYKEYL